MATLYQLNSFRSQRKFSPRAGEREGMRESQYKTLPKDSEQHLLAIVGCFALLGYVENFMLHSEC